MGHDATADDMAEFTLRKAAELVGKSKSTIFRAIKTGRLSATKTDTGDFAIQAAELFRVYKPLKGAASVSGTAQRSTQRQMGHDATANATVETPVETAVRMAELETELRVLRELLDELKRQRDDYKTERDSWRDRAEHLLTFERPAKEQAPKADVIRTESMADIMRRMRDRQAQKSA